MALVLFLLGCGATCGSGTVEKDHVCVAAEDTAGGTSSDDSGSSDSDSGSSDSASDSGTDTASDSGADSGEDSADDSGEDSGVEADPCAPPDAWTGEVDTALYTTTAYDLTYDSGLTAMIPYFPGGSSSSSYSDISFLVYNATVVAYSPDDLRIFVADGAATFPVIPSGSGPSTATVGDKVGFATHSLESSADENRIVYVDGWTVLSSANPVSARELGADNIDYFSTWAQLTHVYGEITGQSSWDCGSRKTCFILDHDGTHDLIRVATANDFGLDPDYGGGLCGEIVAPVGVYGGTSGDAMFLDVLRPTWMRVWSKP